MTTYARRLGLFSATMAVVGGIVGGGIFRTPAAVAERVGSPDLALGAWVVGGVVALIGAFCFGELGYRRPRAGGGYVYLREAWGPLPAFLYGWALLLVIATGAIAAVAVTFADYTLALTGLPPALSAPVAVGAIVLLAGVNYVGVAPGAITVNVLTVLKLAALAAVIVVGLAVAAPASPPPLAAVPPADRAWVLTLGAALVPILFTYGGWQQTNFIAEEIVAPERTLPRALVLRGADRGGGVPAREPRLPSGARAAGARAQHGARGRHDAGAARPRRRNLHRGGDRRLHLRLSRPGDPGDAPRAAGHGRGRRLLPLARAAPPPIPDADPGHHARGWRGPSCSP